MQNISVFSKCGQWYKGNLHCHSTVSDGFFTQEKIVELYKERGYNFIAFTEHEIYTDRTDLDSKAFILMPGIERSISLGNGQVYHINGIGDFYNKCENRHSNGEEIPVPKYDDMEVVQNIIDELGEHGNMVMINHPYWSWNSMSDINSLKNYDFMEIYNGGCDVETNTGYSETYWDNALQNGCESFGVATDDNHNYNYLEEADNLWDSFKGWVCVKAEELTRESISKALKEGQFYSSSGPEIHSIEIEENEVKVKCSPCKEIYFISYPRRGFSRREVNGELITETVHKLTGREQYIRVKCVDENNNSAWSNAIFFKI